MSNFEKLREEILNLSNNNINFNIAKKEWFVSHLEKTEEPKTCLCGKNPIKNLCYIKNNLNGNETLVGNCCVKHFELNYDWYFQGIKRIKNNLRPTGQFIIYLFENNIINQWELNFLKDRENTKKASFKQEEKEKQIIKKILYKLEK